MKLSSCLPTCRVQSPGHKCTIKQNVRVMAVCKVRTLEQYQVNFWQDPQGAVIVSLQSYTAGMRWFW